MVYINLLYKASQLCLTLHLRGLFQIQNFNIKYIRISAFVVQLNLTLFLGDTKNTAKSIEKSHSNLALIVNLARSREIFIYV